MRTGRTSTLPAILFAALAASLCARAELPPPAQRAVNFATDVRPLLQEHCVACHGPDKQKSGYRLDSREAAVKGGDSGDAAILPGKSADSPLIQFVAGLDADKLMPPKKSDKPRLTAEQIGVLRAWIDHGAEWPEDPSVAKRDPLDWWSLKPIAKPAMPEIQNPKSKIRLTPSSARNSRKKISRRLPKPIPAHSAAASASTSPACRRRRKSLRSLCAR